MRRGLLRLWNRAFARPSEDELAAELESHLSMQVEDNIRAGMPPGAARRAAILKFGGLEATKESYRDMRGFPILDTFGRDLRHALRSYRRRPAFFAAGALSLALGIGSATAVFSVVDRTLFRSLPYANPGQLVSVGIDAPLIAPHDWLFAATYQDWRRSPGAPFHAVTSWIRVSDCDLTAASAPARLSCAEVEQTFLPVLGVEPELGRNFSPDEDRDGGPAAVIIGSHLWRSRYASDPNVIGRQIILDGTAHTVAGVLPSSFQMPSLMQADVLLPQRLREGAQRQRVLRAIGRLRPGFTPAAAQAHLSGLFDRFTASASADFRKAIDMRLRVETLQDQQTKEYRLASWLLLAAVLSVLLIACANASNLLLTEAASRRRELAVRSALGATRGRLFAQRITEGALLSGVGGAAGLALAFVLLRAAIAWAPAGLLRLHEARLDVRVLLFAAGASLLTGIAAGLTACLDTPRQEDLSGGRVVGSRANAFKLSLISAQVAASMVLLTTAGLLIGSLRNLQQSPLGLAPGNVVTATYTLNPQRYNTPEKQIAFHSQLEEALGHLQGAEAVTISDSLPPAGDPRSIPYVAMLGGGDRSAAGMSGTVIWRYVTPDYFRAMGIRMVRGRAFNQEDAQSDGQVMIVNQTLAARLFPGSDPIGKEAANSVERSRIVGVAADVRNGGISSAPRPEFYVVRRRKPGGVYNNQRPPYGWRRATAILRTSLPQATAAAWMHAEFAKLDPSLPVELGTLQQHVDSFLQRPRFTGWVLTFFAAMALLLAAVGLYGVVSYTVAGRTREIGIRIALGAAAASIIRMALQDGMKWVAIGAAAGLILSLWVGRLLRGLLFQIPERDPRVLAGALAILTLVAIAACFIPARRAARVDPTLALRHD